MQVTLLAVGPSDFEGDLSIETMFGGTPRLHKYPRSSTPSQHVLEQVKSFRTVRVHNKLQRKRRQYACKVCSILIRAQRKTAWETAYLCRTCSDTHGSGIIYLCQLARQHGPNGTHQMCRSGTDTPEGVRYVVKLPMLGDNKIGESVLELIKIEVRLQNTPNYQCVAVIFDIPKGLNCVFGMYNLISSGSVDVSRRTSQMEPRQLNLQLPPYKKRGQSAKPKSSKDQMKTWRYFRKEKKNAKAETMFTLGVVASEGVESKCITRKKLRKFMRDGHTPGPLQIGEAIKRNDKTDNVESEKVKRFLSTDWELTSVSSPHRIQGQCVQAQPTRRTTDGAQNCAPYRYQGSKHRVVSATMAVLTGAESRNREVGAWNDR
ncbi:Hypothetical protein PHPALM_16841 [Phytophthora palmivora]|uniref:Uncharacterized protein n=1 Tax=Phytophthora palmivora TaxID=4796 RepID=A0A2P4XNS7_9STRA|nr:Hypothetical protein PHPALM_16841 [Phytophthora palmivora]